MPNLDGKTYPYTVDGYKAYIKKLKEQRKQKRAYTEDDSQYAGSGHGGSDIPGGAG